ncbi:EF-hand domain-containing protein [Sphingomonas sp. CARO-RG-8B-R24-01]|uniref:EF-hand domain-containing protein n=1 Tax=Sphingomonas sp. CARO-RG-8B-R24-01 TaxID=2914831 RepID=UPI001F59F62A|nr:EF-hand domain-containing protein [Sphingomonas sp. CARO-RG-8B-R24-01]
MWRYIVGCLATLALVAAGVLLFNRNARSVAALPAAPMATTQQGAVADGLPDQAPAASDQSREAKRFERYDKDRNGTIGREEYLAPRRKAFAKLDANHDGTLSFDEWAVKTEAKFTEADKDKSGGMTAAEFATTAPKRKPPRIRRDCPPPAAASTGEES